MFLLDTNVVSELRRTRPHGAVLAWLNAVDDGDLHIAAVTIAEIQAGIEITREQDRAKADDLEAWLDLVAQSYNVVPMDTATFRLWARMMHGTSDVLLEDALIAATAQIHRFTVVTRNLRDFERFKVPTLDPFKTPRR